MKKLFSLIFCVSIVLTSFCLPMSISEDIDIKNVYECVDQKADFVNGIENDQIVGNEVLFISFDIETMEASCEIAILPETSNCSMNREIFSIHTGKFLFNSDLLTNPNLQTTEIHNSKICYILSFKELSFIQSWLNLYLQPNIGYNMKS